jgi:addiction module RelE/StbE family toxin
VHPRWKKLLNCMQNIKIRQIHFSPHFFRSFNKLPKSIQELSKKKDEVFRRNPFDARLRTHKLKGELAGVWAYSINYEYRVLFRFIEPDQVLYYDIGTHGIYK